MKPTTTRAPSSALDSTINSAYELIKAGRIDEADQLCRGLLALTPNPRTAVLASDSRSTVPSARLPGTGRCCRVRARPKSSTARMYMSERMRRLLPQPAHDGHSRFSTCSRGAAPTPNCWPGMYWTGRPR